MQLICRGQALSNDTLWRPRMTKRMKTTMQKMFQTHLDAPSIPFVTNLESQKLSQTCPKKPCWKPMGCDSTGAQAWHGINWCGKHNNKLRTRACRAFATVCSVGKSPVEYTTGTTTAIVRRRWGKCGVDDYDHVSCRHPPQSRQRQRLHNNVQVS